MTDFERIENFKTANGVYWLKLESISFKKTPLDQDDYDCLSLYRHGDMTHEWRPCRVMKQELLPKFKPNVTQGTRTREVVDFQSYSYWVEFWHCRDQGSQMWFKRNFAEILFSADYTRNQ